MDRGQGGIGLFTIASIFIVVFAIMYGGIQHSKGDLIPDRTLDQREEAIRSAVWDEVDRVRTEAGRSTARRSQYESVTAQGTAVRFAEAGVTGTFVSPSNGPTGEFALTNGGPYCAQVAVSHPFGDPDLSTADTARSIVSTLDAGDRNGVLYRGQGYINGVGVVISEDTAYVVYRTCAIKTP